jgi:hypothetical protein
MLVLSATHRFTFASRQGIMAVLPATALTMAAPGGSPRKVNDDFHGDATRDSRAPGPRPGRRGLSVARCGRYSAIRSHPMWLTLMYCCFHLSYSLFRLRIVHREPLSVSSVPIPCHHGGAFAGRDSGNAQGPRLCIRATVVRLWRITVDSQ